MDPEQIEEFFPVRARCDDARRAGGSLGSYAIHRACQFLICPSFENPISWDVVEVAQETNGPATRLYRTTWDKEVALGIMLPPLEPRPHPYKLSPQTGWVPADTATFERLFSRIRNIRIPLIVANPALGCDGTNYELALGNSWCHARIKWWSEMPTEWRELAAVVVELEQLFESTWKRGRD